MLKNEGKKFFLIGTAKAARQKKLSEWILTKFPDAVIYTSSDHMDCVLKLKNVPPNFLVCDYELNKSKAGQTVEVVLSDKANRTGIIVLDVDVPNDILQDAVVLGKAQILPKEFTEEQFNAAITDLSNYAFSKESNPYQVKLLKPGDVLLKEGDTSKTVYIVRKGELKAYKNVAGKGEQVLGKIGAGEFVGEMAYFNGEPRMANVAAVTDCEIIEIEPVAFEQVIYQRPTWVKTLVSTLSRRLRK